MSFYYHKLLLIIKDGFGELRLIRDLVRNYTIYKMFFNILSIYKDFESPNIQLKIDLLI